MATAQTLIDRSLRLIDQLNSGESGTAQESADLLIELNDILDMWRNENLMCYAMQDETIPLVSGNTTRTIGPSGNLVSVRPTQINDAYIVYQNTSVPVHIIEFDEYAAIPDKTVTSSYPSVIYYKPEMPDGKIYMYPLPDTSSDLHVLTLTPFTAFASLATSASLPPGYEAALVGALAVRAAPTFNKDPKPSVIQMANNAKRLIKRTNARPLKQTDELFAIGRQHRSNILVDR
jgi:hypothetical protein